MTLSNEQLQRLIAHIKKNTPDGAHWCISTDDLIARLGVDPTLFYRLLYELQNRIYFTDAIDGFTPDNAGDLVTVLESFFGSTTEETLARAGLFLPHLYRIELMACFFDCVQNFLRSHVVQYEEFESLLERKNRFEAAFDDYLRMHVSIDALIESAFTLFNQTRNLDSFAHHLGITHLKSLFVRHVLTARGVFATLEKMLRRHFGYQDRTQDFDESEEGDAVDIARACQVMGLEGIRYTSRVLKKKYKALMKLYHPDVNPDGLERCKEINTAYAFLLARSNYGDRRR